MAQARTNGAEDAQHSSWSVGGNLWFYDQVKEGSPWDYKQYHHAGPNGQSGYENFGNYNYGYTGAAMGYSLDFLDRQGGLHQNQRDPSARGKQPWLWGTLGGTPPYGDALIDQKYIRQGYEDYKKWMLIKSASVQQYLQY